jgi:hypothetical protein
VKGGLVPAGRVDGETRGRQQRGGPWERGGGEGGGEIHAVGDMRGPVAGIVLDGAVDGPRNMGR